MNANFDFARNFLLAVERQATDPATPLSREALGFMNVPVGLYVRQVALFDRSGLLESVRQENDEGGYLTPTCLTKEGVEFLDKIRDEKVWKRVLEVNNAEVATFSMSVLMALAERINELEHKDEKSARK